MSKELSEIFHRDPLAMSKEDVDEIVRYYQSHRDKFVLVKKDGTLKKVRAKAANKTKAKKATVDPNQIDLEELIASKDTSK